MNTRSFNNIASLLVSVATVAIAATLPSAAQAQTTGYIGDAYLVKASVGTGTTVLNSVTANLGVGAKLVDTGNLSPTVQQTRNGLGVGVTGTVGAGSLGLLGAEDLVGANVSIDQTTSLIPSPFSAVNSTAAVTNLSLLNLSGLDINVAGVGINLFGSPYVAATLVQSNTGANLNGSKSGTTTIAGLTVNGVAASKLLAGNANVTVNGDGSLTITAPTSLTVYTNATVDGSGNLATHGAAIGTLFLDEQLTDPITGALTTNAIHLDVNSNLTATMDAFLSSSLGLGSLTAVTVDAALNPSFDAIAGSDVIVSSSTAGYNASVNTAAPEPGSIALLGVGLLPAMGLLRLRSQRRNKKNATA